ncbi:LuxR C-terminal-related transcriptional regulator [Leclercia adecarboxylata]|uniref:LuxR C-terminal-related transcriptional regulator n=1 Tax=Leclercia adecarboxylata TaxID=83655 RepID=UPI002DBD135B|nr:LuxR C-terminal-related transcriptional regulator [Leclercia adecarboxylata]MEB6377847.1 LuxR C-terminal-related transcriptional regulator [Leclercia adecarboxylata]
MSAILLSDNYYLCAGTEGSQVDTLFICDELEVEKLCKTNAFTNIIIAIEQDSLRNNVISAIKKSRSRYIVLLNAIESGRYVKIDNIIYSSLHFRLQPLQYLVEYYHSLRQHWFTRREYEVLNLAHLENHKIAKRLKLSQKTISTYRIKIQEKMHMRAKNPLAMNRVKSALLDQKL